MYGIIYKVTNLINNKIYIGQTVRGLEARKRDHKNEASRTRRNSKFYNSIRKYGFENFIFEIIDYANSEDELNNKEIYWIDFYGSFNSGLNSTLGGLGSSGLKLEPKWSLDDVKNAILKIMKDLNYDKIPQIAVIKEVNSPLIGAIQRYGGIRNVSKLVGIDTECQYVIWDDEMIKDSIINISNKHLEGKYMPTRMEIFKFTKESKIDNVISKTYGYRGWAEKTGLIIRDKKLITREYGLDFIKQLLDNMNISYIEMDYAYRGNHYLIVNKNIRLFINCSNPTIKRSRRRHKFNIKSESENDLNIFCAFDEDGEVENVFVVPHYFVSNIKYIETGFTSKYNQYIDKWDILFDLISTINNSIKGD